MGQALEVPKKGDVPQPLNKGPIIQSAAPPNPLPADKPATPADADSKPAAAKPTVHDNAAASNQNANILAFAITLFGAVYFL